MHSELPEMIGEAVHHRLYTLHWQAPGARFSFAYATLCDWLSERGRFRLDGDGQADLVGVVLRRAAEAYDLNADGIAFSKSSVQGAMNWLKATDPPALTDGDFARRQVAPSLSVLWAVDAVYRSRGTGPGTRLSLDGEVEGALSRLLLLDPDELPAVLHATARTEGSRIVGGGRWLTLGTEGGFGRWLLLNAPCPVGAAFPGEESGDDLTSRTTLEEDGEESGEEATETDRSGDERGGRS